MLLASLLNFASRTLGALILVSLILCGVGIELSHGKPRDGKRKPSSLKVLSTAQVVAAIDLQDFGSHVVRYGRLSPDQGVGAVFIQVNREREVTCITAVSLPDGKVLWQRGQPHRRHFRTTGDIPVQVYDWNGDGFDDVVYYDSVKIVILSGSDGSVINSSEIEEPYSLYVFPTNQFGGSPGLILHGRSFNSLLAPDLSLVWRVSNGFSHFPMSVDVDNDGEPELLAGYVLLNSHGQTIWNKRQLGIHNDAAAYGDVNCDGGIELAIATSGRAALLSPAGDIFWRGDENHAQHILVGSFDSRTCEKQVATMDRDKEQSGILRMYDARGRLLWKSSGHGKRAMLSKIDNWIADTPMSLLLVSRSFSAPPTLYDGSGKVVARLPFPPALQFEEGESRYSFYFTQHFDMDNDGKEEVLISNERALWIYANATPTLGIQGGKAAQALPNPRIYNATFYTGMQ
jgi:rhamnogalacturonan endolyase